MMRRNGNVINLEAVLIVLPYTALYFLMWLNILIIRGERWRMSERSRRRWWWEMLKMSWRVFTPAASLSLKLFIMPRRYTPLRKTLWLLQGCEGKPEPGTAWQGKGEGMSHPVIDLWAKCWSGNVSSGKFLRYRWRISICFQRQCLAQK